MHSSTHTLRHPHCPHVHIHNSHPHPHTPDANARILAGFPEWAHTCCRWLSISPWMSFNVVPIPVLEVRQWVTRIDIHMSVSCRGWLHLSPVSTLNWGKEFITSAHRRPIDTSHSHENTACAWESVIFHTTCSFLCEFVFMYDAARKMFCPFEYSFGYLPCYYL